MYSFFYLFFLAAYGLSAVSAQNGDYERRSQITPIVELDKLRSVRSVQLVQYHLERIKTRIQARVNELRSSPIWGTVNRCVLPEYPKNGYYTVSNMPNASPGQAFDTVVLTLTCNPGYTLSGSAITACSNSKWSQPMPRCSAVCKLTRDESVNYRCKVTGDHEMTGLRSCNEYEPSGTIVVPECNRPNYYYNGMLLDMRCIDGFWDRIVVCKPECGTPIAKSEQLIINGVSAKRGELPWHAGIYSKNSAPYKQICGGSLISKTLVISAAHCFWRDGEGLEPVDRYAVGLGKIYRPWNDSNDIGAHKSDVRDIRVPVRYLGEHGHFQEDIALVVMTTPVEFVPSIRPVCINFDVDFDNRQLHSGNFGKVVGWGLTEENGRYGSPVLKTADIPYVDIGKCIADMPYSFRSHITSDKICGGDLNGNINLCKGDSGGGFVFPDVDQGILRYYLRGVVSSAPRTERTGSRCNTQTYTSFTHILKHALFIKEKIGSEGRQSSPYSCETNPEAVYCVARVSDRNGDSQQREPSQPQAPPRYEPPPSDYDKQPIAAVRNVFQSIFGKIRGG